jgi:hypothetical protein
MRKSTTDEIIGSYQDRFTGCTNGTQNSFKMKKQLEHKLKELEDSDVSSGSNSMGLTPSRGSESEFRHPYLCRYEMR